MNAAVRQATRRDQTTEPFESSEGGGVAYIQGNPDEIHELARYEVRPEALDARSRSWPIALWILIALLSGPATVTAVWLLAEAAAKAGFIVLPGGAPRFSGPNGREGDVTELLATGDQTGGSLGLVRQVIAPGSGPPAHVHKAEDEFFYVVSGAFKVRLGDRILSAPAQSVMFIPRGTAHTFENVGTEPGVLLVGVTPGGFEKMFEERQGVDAATNRALMAKHKMEVVGPPLQ